MTKQVNGEDPASIEHYLRGLHFSAGRQKILSHVKKSQGTGAALNHHQSTICCVSIGRSSAPCTRTFLGSGTESKHPAHKDNRVLGAEFGAADVVRIIQQFDRDYESKAEEVRQALEKIAWANRYSPMLCHERA